MRADGEASVSYAHDSAVVDRHRPVAVQLPHEHLVHAVVRHGPEQPRHDPDILMRVQARVHDAAQVLEHAVRLAIIELIRVQGDGVDHRRHAAGEAAVPPLTIRRAAERRCAEPARVDGRVERPPILVGVDEWRRAKAVADRLCDRGEVGEWRAAAGEELVSASSSTLETPTMIPLVLRESPCIATTEPRRTPRRSLFARSLLALLDECNPDASSDRAFHLS